MAPDRIWKYRKNAIFKSKAGRTLMMAAVLAVSVAMCFSCAGCSKESAPAKQPTLAEYFQTLTIFEEKTVQGSNDDVIDIPVVGEPCLIEFSSDEGISITAFDNSGKEVDWLLTGYSPAQAGTTTSWNALTAAGNRGAAAQLQVKSDGLWTLRLQPMMRATTAENGKTYIGPQVLLVDADEMNGLTFKAERSDGYYPEYISVKAVGTYESETIENILKRQTREILNGAVEDNYESTAVWRMNHSVVIVDYSGTWTISW